MNLRARKSVMQKVVVVTGAVVVTVAGLSAGPAHAQASKQGFLGFPDGACEIGATAGIPTDNFAVINSHAGMVSAQVLLKGMEPNTTYYVNLVQVPSGDDCGQHPPDATVTTNGQGIGTAHLSEPIRPDQTGAFVLFNSPNAFQATPAVPVG